MVVSKATTGFPLWSASLTSGWIFMNSCRVPFLLFCLVKENFLPPDTIRLHVDAILFLLLTTPTKLVTPITTPFYKPPIATPHLAPPTATPFFYHAHCSSHVIIMSISLITRKRKAFISQPAPPGYVPGLGRG